MSKQHGQSAVPSDSNGGASPSETGATSGGDLALSARALTEPDLSHRLALINAVQTQQNAQTIANTTVATAVARIIAAASAGGPSAGQAGPTAKKDT